MKIGVLIMSILSFLTGCNTIKGDQYQELNPKFSLEQFFSGKIKAWGIIQDTLKILLLALKLTWWVPGQVIKEF